MATKVIYANPSTDAALAVFALMHMLTEPCEILAMATNGSNQDAILAKIEKTDTVYLLGTIGKNNFTDTLLAACTELIIVDHHSDARKIGYEERQRLYCDPPGMCTSRLALCVSSGEYVKPNQATAIYEAAGTKFNEEMLMDMIDLVEDETFKVGGMLDAPAFNKGFMELIPELDIAKNPKLLLQIAAIDPKKIIVRGKELLVKYKENIDSILKNTFTLELPQDNSWGIGVFCDDYTMNNEIAAAINNPIVYIIANAGEDEYKISIRSQQDKLYLAKELGGGGQPNASGFTIKKNKLSKISNKYYVVIS